MHFPNRLQAALLFDRPVADLDAMMRDFLRIESLRSGTHFHLSQQNPGMFYRLFGASEELMVTFEYVEAPCNPQAFEGSLASAYTGIVTPDIRERIGRTRSHILLEVSHGVMAGVEEQPKIAAMFDAIGMPRPGATREKFERRLGVLRLMTQIAIDRAMPLAVHWTQSGVLVKGELFETMAAGEDMPGPLHIHPYLFGPTPRAGERPLVGIQTIGARHWIGQEILVQPNVLPWAANFETILAFLRIATMPNGYVIPDGDTFGPEDRSLSYRVIHRRKGDNIGHAEPESAEHPVYELVPLKHVEYGFVAPDHVPEANVFDDQAFPLDIMPVGQEERMALANEWFQRRKLAEGIGGRFEVRAAGEAGAPPTPPPPPPPAPVIAPTPNQPGLPSLTGRGLRSRLFGSKGS